MDFFKLPELPYAYDALEPYIDKETMRIHHDMHHAGYTKNLNAAIEGYEKLQKMSIEEILRNLESVDEKIRTAVRNNGGGFANHDIFWKVMSEDKDQKPEGKLANAIDKSFSSFDKFMQLFSEKAAKHFGSGWAWLTLDGGKLEISDTLNQDSPITDGKTPILALDVWEHAYYLKYQNRRPEYIEAWWHVVNWKEVGSRFEKTN